LTGNSDPIQSELDKTAQSSQVELELAKLKGAVGAGSTPSGELAAGASGAGASSLNGDHNANEEDVEDAEVTDDPKAPADPFSLGDKQSTP
jgi:hypothetical protein